MATPKPRNKLKLLFADDERSLQELMSLELPRMGHEVTVCPDGLTALAALERNTYDCIIVDLDMPGCSGIQVIEKLRETSPDTEAVILTGKSSLDTAVSAVRLGAFDYLTKPCKLIELSALLERVSQKKELKNKYRAAKRQLERIVGKSNLIGESPRMEDVRKLIRRVGPTSSTVLIRGETGTGKELVARAIHDQSPRADMPYVAINCGALPESLIESELFGHRKGAFTGADQQRVGLFEVASGGTLFLDEIGELPKGVQAKLLRFLESGEIRRVGENEAFVVDVRVVCATHRDLEQMVHDNEFREDLMFRINTFEIYLPPLRDREGDVALLAKHLLSRSRQGIKPEDPTFTPEALRLLEEHTWPGNVRELANVVEHAAILCEELPIRPENLPTRKFEASRRAHAQAAGGATAAGPTQPYPTNAAYPASQPYGASPSYGASHSYGASPPYGAAPNAPVPPPVRQMHAPSAPIPQPHFMPSGNATPTLREIELHVIQQVFARHGGNKHKAAEELGISVKTLYNKLHQIQQAGKVEDEEGEAEEAA